VRIPLADFDKGAAPRRDRRNMPGGSAAWRSWPQEKRIVTGEAAPRAVAGQGFRNRVLMRIIAGGCTRSRESRSICRRMAGTKSRHALQDRPLPRMADDRGVRARERASGRVRSGPARDCRMMSRARTDRRGDQALCRLGRRCVALSERTWLTAAD